MADVFKALADPTRRAILDELVAHSGQTLFEICGRLTTIHGLSSSRQAISQHLEVLEDAGLITTRREGRYKFHDVDTAPLAAITDRWPIPMPVPSTSAPSAPPRSARPAPSPSDDKDPPCPS